jgi:hypothetical protein
LRITVLVMRNHVREPGQVTAEAELSVGPQGIDENKHRKLN